MNPKLCFCVGVLIIYSSGKWCIIYNHLLVDAVLRVNSRGWKGRTGNSRGSQPGFLERIFSYSSSSSSSSSSFTAAVRRGGSEQLHTKRREGGWECYRDGSGPPWHETDRTASYKQGIWYPTNMVTKHIFHLSQQNACVDVIKQVKSNKTRVSSPKMTLINEWRHLKILNRPDIIQLVYIEIHVMVLHNQN